MTDEEMLADLQRKRREIDVEIAIVRDRMCDAKAKFKPGDIVTDGKPLPTLYEIVGAYLYVFGGVKYKGRKLKKDGTPGTKISDIWRNQENLTLVRRPE